MTGVHLALRGEGIGKGTLEGKRAVCYNKERDSIDRIDSNKQDIHGRFLLPRFDAHFL